MGRRYEGTNEDRTRSNDDGKEAMTRAETETKRRDDVKGEVLARVKHKSSSLGEARSAQP